MLLNRKRSALRIQCTRTTSWQSPEPGSGALMHHIVPLIITPSIFSDRQRDKLAYGGRHTQRLPEHQGGAHNLIVLNLNAMSKRQQSVTKRTSCRRSTRLSRAVRFFCTLFLTFLLQQLRRPSRRRSWHEVEQPLGIRSLAGTPLCALSITKQLLRNKQRKTTRVISPKLRAYTTPISMSSPNSTTST